MSKSGKSPLNSHWYRDLVVHWTHWQYHQRFLRNNLKISIEYFSLQKTSSVLIFIMVGNKIQKEKKTEEGERVKGFILNTKIK